MQSKKTPLSDVTVFLMIFVALCFDGIQALIGWIPMFGNILAGLLNIFIFLTFFLWFKMYGISMITPKRLTAMIGGGLVELVPFINILPAWTGVVIYLIGTTKIKELVAKHPTLAKGAVAVGGRIKSMNRTGKDPDVPSVDNKGESQQKQVTPAGFRELPKYEPPTGKNVLRDKKDYTKRKTIEENKDDNVLHKVV